MNRLSFNLTVLYQYKLVVKRRPAIITACCLSQIGLLGVVKRELTYITECDKLK